MHKNRKPIAIAKNKTLKHMILRAGPAIYGGLTIARKDNAFDDTSGLNKDSRINPKSSTAQSAHNTSQNKIALIRGAIPGELVEITVDSEKSNYLSGTASRIIEPSSERVAPQCKYFGTCGGCHYQFISYSKQVEMKQEALSDCLRRIGGIDVCLDESLTDTSNIWGYRYRGRFKVFADGIGFSRERSNEPVEIDSCPLMAEIINDGLTQIRIALAEKPHLLPLIDELSLACGDDELFASIKTTRGIDRADRRLGEIPDLLAVCGLKGSRIITDDGSIISHGEHYLTLPLRGLKYATSADGFFQSNWKLNLQMLDTLTQQLEQIESLQEKRTLDLYSGAGNFALALAKYSSSVTAVEENPYAVQAGIRNTEINSVDNVRFVESTAEKALDKQRNKVDILVIDPPRSGIGKQVTDRILEARPRLIAYISCNPSTFARDLKAMSRHYNVESIRLIDMFPQTYHIESLALLQVK